MSLDQHHDDPVEAKASDRSPADQALAGYTSRMHRLGLWYAGIVALIVAVTIAVVAVVMSHSEIAHASLHRFSVAAPIAGADPAPTQSLAWSSSDRLAIGTPFYSGTVVTFSAHTMSGRNARTGVVTWAYTRTDMTICEAAQEQGQAIAIFNREGNCDEIDAFDTNTGARSWSRTLDSNGQATDGIPTFAVSADTLLLTTPAQVQAIVPTGASAGIDRWNTPAPAGCTNIASVLGPNGVLISQSCKDGHYLLLRDAYASDQIDSKPNPKLQLWRVKVAADVVPVSANTQTSAYDATSGDLLVYSATGTVTQHLPLTPRPTSPVTPVTTTLSGVDTVWMGGQAYQLGAAGSTIAWTRALVGPPTLTTVNSVAMTATGISLLDPNTGVISQTFPTPSAPTGTVVYPVGAGFVIGRGVAGGGATAVYR